MTRTTFHTASPQHEALKDAFTQAIATSAPDMPSIEILAVACVFVGQLIALQDAKYPVALVMEMVGQNIEFGNQTAIEQHIIDNGGRN